MPWQWLAALLLLGIGCHAAREEGVKLLEDAQHEGMDQLWKEAEAQVHEWEGSAAVTRVEEHLLRDAKRPVLPRTDQAPPVLTAAHLQADQAAFLHVPSQGGIPGRRHQELIKHNFLRGFERHLKSELPDAPSAVVLLQLEANQTGDEGKSHGTTHMDAALETYTEHRKQLLHNAREDTGQLQRLTEKLSTGVLEKRAQAVRAQAELETFQDKVRRDTALADGDLFASKREADSASDAAHDAAQKVLQFENTEDQLSKDESSSYKQGEALASQIQFDNDVAGNTQAAIERRVDQKHREVQQRIQAIHDGTSENTAREAVEAGRARIRAKQTLAAQEKARRQALAMQTGDTVSVMEDKMGAMISQAGEQQAESEHRLRKQIDDMRLALHRNSGVQKHNQEMRLKLKLMEEKLNSAMLAHKLGLVDSNARPPTEDQLKHHMSEARLRIAARRGRVDATQEEIARIRAKLAKAVAQGGYAAAGFKTQAEQATAAAEEREKEALVRHEGIGLSDTELADYNYGTKIAEEALNAAEGEADVDEVHAAEAGDAATTLGESNDSGKGEDGGVEQEEKQQEAEEEAAAQENAKVDNQMAQEKADAAQQDLKRQQQRAAVDSKMSELEAQAKVTEQRAKSALSTQAAEMDSQATRLKTQPVHDDPQVQHQQLTGLTGTLNNMKAALARSSEIANAGLPTSDVAASLEAQQAQVSRKVEKAKMDAERIATQSAGEEEKLKGEVLKEQELLKEAEDKLSRETAVSDLKDKMQEEVDEEKAEMKIQAIQAREEKRLRDRLANEKRAALARQRALRSDADTKRSELMRMRQRLTAEEEQAAALQQKEKIKLKAQEQEQEAAKTLVVEEQKAQEAREATVRQQLEDASAKQFAEDAKLGKVKAGLKELERASVGIAAEVEEKRSNIDQKTRENDRLTSQLRERTADVAKLRHAVSAKQAGVSKTKADLAYFSKKVDGLKTDEAKAGVLKNQLAGLDGNIKALAQESKASAHAEASAVDLAREEAEHAEAKAAKEKQEAAEEEKVRQDKLAAMKTQATKELAKLRQAEKIAAFDVKRKLEVAKEKNADEEKRLSLANKRREQGLKDQMEADDRKAKRALAKQAQQAARDLEALAGKTEREEAEMKAKVSDAKEAAIVAASKAADEEATLQEELRDKKDGLQAKTQAELAEAREAGAAEEARLKADADAKVKVAEQQAAQAEAQEKRAAANMATTEDAIQEQADQLAAKTVKKVRDELQAQEKAAVAQINKSKQDELETALMRQEDAKQALASEGDVEDAALKAIRELKQRQQKMRMKMATELAVAHAKLTHVTSKLPTLQLTLREASPGIDRVTKSLAEADNSVSRLQRLNQAQKAEIVQLKASNSMTQKRVDLAEQEYAVTSARVVKLQTATKKFQQKSKRLRVRIGLLSKSRDKIANSGDHKKKAALAAKMEKVESSLSSEQLKQKQKQEERRLEQLRDKAAEKGAEAMEAKENLRPNWGLVSYRD